MTTWIQMTPLASSIAVEALKVVFVMSSMGHALIASKKGDDASQMVQSSDVHFQIGFQRHEGWSQLQIPLFPFPKEQNVSASI